MEAYNRQNEFALYENPFREHGNFFCFPLDIKVGGGDQASVVPRLFLTSSPVIIVGNVHELDRLAPTRLSEIEGVHRRVPSLLARGNQPLGRFGAKRPSH